MENETEKTDVANVDSEMAAAFDVSAYEISDTAVLEVQNIKRTGDLIGPNGQPVRIIIYSPGSKRGVRALHRAGLAAQMRLRATFIGRIDKDSAQQADEERASKLCAITEKIENFPISKEKLYANPKLVDIANQVDEFFGSLHNFTRGDTVSSPSTLDI